MLKAENTEESGELQLGRVLLVDDEPELRRVLRRGLVRAGFDVVEANDGLVALELVRRRDFDVVISDVCMPRLGGLALLSRLEVEAPLLPVVLVSGLSGFVDRAAAIEYGAFDCLEKPMSLGELRASAAAAVAVHRRRLAAEHDGHRASETRLVAAAPALLRAKSSA